MLLYLIIFLVGAGAYVLGGRENRSRLFLGVYVAFLALFVGLSDMFGGYDRYIYGQVFDSFADDVTNGLSFSQAGMRDYFETGYQLFTWALAHITENRYIYILIVTLIMYFNVYKVMSRHMRNYPLAMVLFFGMLFFFSFTYLRQFLACSIAWFAIKYMLERRWVVFALLMIVVVMLHKAGIVFVVVFMLPIRKFPRGVVACLLLMCLAVGVSGVMASVYDLYVEIQNLEVLKDDVYGETEGARIAYILEALLVAGYILMNYDKVKDNRESILFLNMALCFCAFLLIFVKSDNGGRMSWLFAMGVIYTVTQIATSERAGSMGVGITKMAIVALCLGMYMRVFIAWQNYDNLYPYKTFLTDGYRQPDFTWERYEYDHNYDDDKFYRRAFRF